MQQTNQYKLNLIESGDAFSATPLNENAEKTEQALEALEQAIENAKASGLQIEAGSYTGTGTYGSGSPNSLTFAFKPYVVIVSEEGSGGYFGTWISGATVGRSFSSASSTESVELTWNNTGLSWYYDEASTSGSGYQLNVNGWIYHYIAIGSNE